MPVRQFASLPVRQFASSPVSECGGDTTTVAATSPRLLGSFHKREVLVFVGFLLE